MRIYADICTLCRPFDDQSQPRIWLETHALCIILNLAEAGQLELVRSPVHEIETARNPREFRQLWVRQCLGLAVLDIPLSPGIQQRALSLEATGVKPLDALHAAAAESVSCTHLLTCDDRFIKRYSGPLVVLNPADFVIHYFQQAP